VRDDVTVEVVLRYLRRFEEMPDHTTSCSWSTAKASGRPAATAQAAGRRSGNHGRHRHGPGICEFHSEEKAQDAAQAFERYDLVSAPVVDDNGKLIGRVTVNAVVDFIREETDSEMLSAGGLREDEDLFARCGKAWKNRWAWLAITW